MDVFAGRVPTSRVGPSHPVTAAIHQAGNRAPILPPAPTWCSFNSPEDCIRDATGVWLKSYVVDGIHYILSFADPTKTKNVVINRQLRADDRTARRHGGTGERH